jgi:hypothetical protein
LIGDDRDRFPIIREQLAVATLVTATQVPVDLAELLVAAERALAPRGREPRELDGRARRCLLLFLQQGAVPRAIAQPLREVKASPTRSEPRPNRRRRPLPSRAACGSHRCRPAPAPSVDGREVGRAPLLPFKVDVGLHEVTVEKSGHAVHRTTVRVEAENSWCRSSRSCAGLHGFVSVGIIFGAEPSFAEVLIDGKSSGTGPIAERKLPVGRHPLEVRRPGYAATP